MTLKEIENRKRSLINLSLDIKNKELYRLRKVSYGGEVFIQIKALKEPANAHNLLLSALNKLGKTNYSNQETLAAARAGDAAYLKYLQANLVNTTSSQAIGLKIYALGEKIDEQNRKYHSLDALSNKNERVEQANEIIDYLNTGADFISTIAKKPLDHLATLKAFMDNMSPKIGALVPSTGKVFEGFKKAGLTAESFQKIQKVFGYAAVALTVTSLVLTAVADRDHWAHAFAGASVTLLATTAVGGVVTSAAVTSVIEASLTALGYTSVSIPSVLPVALAAGVIIGIGIGVAALANWLLTTWFGGGIPPELRVSLTTNLTSSLRTSLTTEL